MLLIMVMLASFISPSFTSQKFVKVHIHLPELAEANNEVYKQPGKETLKYHVKLFQPFFEPHRRQGCSCQVQPNQSR